MEFASEMVIKAQLKGMKIAEVPTVLSRDGRSRPPHLRPYRDGWRASAVHAPAQSALALFLPGLRTLMLVGLAGCSWLLPGPNSGPRRRL